MMKKNILKKASSVLAAVVAFTAIPVLGAIVVQNFMTFDVVVEEPPIIKELGGDAGTTQYLDVNLGGTISNGDTANNETFLSNEQIEFTCFAGDRTYYTDVIQLTNTTGTETWNVNMIVEADIQGDPAVEDTFADASTDGGDADIWLFTSSADTTTTPVAERPNPTNIGSLTSWNNTPIHLEVVGSTLSTVTTETGSFAIAGGESRQVGLVVDCGANMLDEAGAGTSGTFRVTLEATL